MAKFDYGGGDQNAFLSSLAQDFIEDGEEFHHLVNVEIANS